MNILSQNEPLASTAIPEGYTPAGATKAMFYTGKIPADAKFISFFRIDGGKIYNYCCTLDDVNSNVIEIKGNAFVLDGQRQSSTYRSGEWTNIGEVSTTVPVVTDILGDADANSQVNVKDATAIQKHVAMVEQITGDNAFAADVDSNSEINVKDATAIQKHVAFKDTGYPIGQEVAVA